MSRRSAALLFVLAACRTVPANFNDRISFDHDDYVYDAQLSADAQRFAFTSLGQKNYSLTLCSREAKTCAPEVTVNGYEFDVESLAWAPDASWVATASRDGVARLFDAAGAAKAAWLSEEKLTAVAVHPSGHAIAIGSEHGLVTLLSLDGTGLHFADEKRLHGDEVRALAFSDDGRLFTAGWDKTVHVLASGLSTVKPGTARVHAERSGGTASIRAVVQGKASLPLALDGRVHATLVLKPGVAQSVGIEVLALKDTVNLPTALGTTVGRVAHDVTLSFKALTLEHVDAVVCDACVPEGAEGALGDGFTEAVEVAFDEVTHEAVLTLKAAAAPERELLQLEELSKFELKGYVNDLSLDRTGAKMALALSESKAQRNMQVYQREKRGEVEPEREWDAAVIADTATGKVLQTFHGHRGVVSTAALSPDGSRVVSGGWDHKLVFHASGASVELGALIRKVRFSKDGNWLSVAAWTPRKAESASPSAFVMPAKEPAAR
ncbi:MAG: WD40 repeat domain-containing protein [Myxococcaceae bacterium]